MVSTQPEPAPILVVDDDPAIRATVAEILDLEGFPVTTAANGEEALRVLEQVTPSLVLLDMRMPRVDGWAFARILKERGISLPILVMSAAQSARAWAAEVEAVSYLAKPFDLPQLVSAVERFRAEPIA